MPSYLTFSFTNEEYSSCTVIYPPTELAQELGYFWFLAVVNKMFISIYKLLYGAYNFIFLELIDDMIGEGLSP